MPSPFRPAVAGRIRFWACVSLVAFAALFVASTARAQIDEPPPGR